VIVPQRSIEVVHRGIGVGEEAFASCQCGRRHRQSAPGDPRLEPLQHRAALVRLTGAYGSLDKVGCSPEQDSRVATGSG